MKDKTPFEKAQSERFVRRFFQFLQFIGGATLPVTIIHYALLAAVAICVSQLPAVIWGVYLCASIATFSIYAVDKNRARDGRWRITERTLHLLALAGGWPGALVAQHVLHHKSRKRSFQVVFWLTVAGNSAVIFYLAHTFF